MIDKHNQLLNEMKQKQLESCDKEKKLSESDMKRIIKYIDNSIFDKDNCSLWSGYVTINKNKYINFYFNKKKTVLHRLLFNNFKENIHDNSYLTYTCKNKGNCCNINHLKLKKIIYKKPSISTTVYFD
jgi:hypothetical protein